MSRHGSIDYLPGNPNKKNKKRWRARWQEPDPSGTGTIPKSRCFHKKEEAVAFLAKADSIIRSHKVSLVPEG